MLEKIDIKEVDMEKYKTEYVRAIWVTPIQIDSFDNVYIAERNGKPIMLVNVLLNERIATLFLSVLCKDHLYDCMTMVLRVINKRWNSISRMT